MDTRERNDPRQYDDLTDQWWQPHGAFAALHWLAAARADLVPPPPHGEAALLDVACGAGLLAPHLARGWRHVGLDLSDLSLRQAAAVGVTPVRADALRLPFADAAFDCVVAGEVLEHLPDLEGACAEVARVLAPGGLLVMDTLADSRFSRIALIGIAEHLPGGPPPGCHRPDLLVDPGRLTTALAAHDVHVTMLGGLRPSIPGYLSWLVRRSDSVRMVPVRSTAGVYRALAVKSPAFPSHQSPSHQNQKESR